MSSGPDRKSNPAVTRLQVYPNPVTEQVNLNLQPTPNENLRVMVYDGQGQEVTTIFSGKTTSRQPLHLAWSPGPNQPNGIYYIWVSGANQTSTHRLVLRR